MLVAVLDIGAVKLEFQDMVVRQSREKEREIMYLCVCVFALMYFFVCVLISDILLTSHKTQIHR